MTSDHPLVSYKLIAFCACAFMIYIDLSASKLCNRLILPRGTTKSDRSTTFHSGITSPYGTDGQTDTVQRAMLSPRGTAA